MQPTGLAKTAPGGQTKRPIHFNIKRDYPPEMKGRSELPFKCTCPIAEVWQNRDKTFAMRLITEVVRYRKELVRNALVTIVTL